MNQLPTRLAGSVQPPEVTDGRIARQWASIEQRLPRRAGSRSGVFYLSVAALPLLAAGIFWAATRVASVPSAGAVIESARTPVTVTLRDGSTLSLDSQTKLHLLRDEAQAVDVELGSGKASFDVTHVRGRTFRVHAGLVVVRVIGTRFEVARTTRDEGSHVQVAVARGVVEVQRQDGTGGIRRLSAGETWSALIPKGATLQPQVATTSQPSAASLVASPSEAGPVADELPLPTSALGSISAAPAAPRSRDSFEPAGLSHVLAGSPSGSASKSQRVAAKARATSATSATSASAPAVSTASAAVLLKRANLARRTGQMREAAEAYTELLRRYPDDGRSGLAAFELGRIRMDALTQPRAALEAFAASLRTSPRASFREDALARVVMAFDQLGERDACRLSRDRYQQEFPGGVHALALATRCGTAP